MSSLLLLIAPALAGDFELGIGLRDAHDDPGLVDGPRLVGRVPLGGGIVLEGDLFYRTSGVETSGLDNTLVYIAHGSSDGVHDFQQPVNKDVWSFSALVDYDFGGRSTGAAIHGGPHLYAGAEVRSVESGFARYDASQGDVPVVLDVEGTKLLPAVVLGSGIDFWIGGTAGWRIGWLNRLSLEDHPDYGGVPNGGKQLMNSVTVTLDFLVGF